MKKFEDIYPILKSMSLEELQYTNLASHLLICAKKFKTTDYITPAKSMKAFSADVGRYLGTLFELDAKAKDPILSSLVGNKNKGGMPGNGFYTQAEALGVKLPLDYHKDKWTEAKRNEAFKTYGAEDGADVIDGLIDAMSKLTKEQREVFLSMAQEVEEDLE